MKKGFSIWGIILISFVAIYFRINAILEDRTKVYNLQFTTLFQDVALPGDLKFEKLLANDKVSLEFKADENKLGTIEILFNNYRKINTDIITFRIKEKGKNYWYYQNDYDSGIMDSGQFFPFGFSPIKDSKNKNYIVEIESKNGNQENSVSLSRETKFFQAKYSFPKAYLLQNKHLIPHFIFIKIKNYLSFFSPKDFFGIYLALVLPFVILLPIFICLPLIEKYYLKKTLKKTLLDNKAIIFLVIIYLITHLQFLTYSQYWDSYWYWKLLLWGLDGFQGAALGLGDLARSFIENFNFLGHPSVGYAGIMSISQFIDDGNVVLLNIENVILAIFAICAFYRIVRYYFPKRGVDNILITAIFAFNPLFYATSISFNLDFGVLIFEVLMIEALIYRKYFWFLFWSIILIFSKEIGILIFFSLFVSYFMFFALKRWWKSNRMIDKHKIIFWVLPLVIFGIYFYYPKGNIWNNTVLVNTGNKIMFPWNDNGVFSFGLNTRNFVTRFFQIFIMNFAWVNSFIVLIAWLKAQIFGEELFKNYSEEKRDFARIIIAVFLVFLVFNLLTIVMPFSRYVVAGVFFTILIFYLLFENIIPGRIFIKRAILALILLLNCIQTFKAIDPSPQILFGKNYLGKNVSSPFFGFHDGLVYNSEFVFVDKLANTLKMYSKGGPNMILDGGATYFFKDVKYIGILEDLDKIYQAGEKRLRYIYIPWFNKREERLVIIKKFYTIKAEKTINYKGYYLEVYDLEAI